MSDSDRWTQSLDELEGYLELDMTRECLALARRLLKSRPLTARTFEGCLEVILIQAPTLAPWRVCVERAFLALPRSARKPAASRMLHFHGSLGDWERAREFVPRRPTTPVDLLFSMWTCLELRDLATAQVLFRRCRRECARLLGCERICHGQRLSGDDEFAVGAFFESMAAFHAQAGDWEEAMFLWEVGRALEPFAPQAWENSIKLRTLITLLETRDAREAVAARRQHGPAESLMFRRLEAAARKEQLAVFQGQERHLSRVVPVGEHWRFGI